MFSAETFGFPCPKYSFPNKIEKCQSLCSLINKRVKIEQSKASLKLKLGLFLQMRLGAPEASHFLEEGEELFLSSVSLLSRPCSSK